MDNAIQPYVRRNLGRVLGGFAMLFGWRIYNRFLDHFAERLANEGRMGAEQLAEQARDWLAQQGAEATRRFRNQLQEIGEAIGQQVNEAYDYIVPHAIEGDHQMELANERVSSQLATNQQGEVTATRNGRRRHNEDSMEEPTSETPAAAAARNTGILTDNAKGSRETPVMNVPPTFGLQETHTTVLPYNQYFSVYGTDLRAPVHIIFSQVNVNQPMVSTITHVLENATTAISGGLADRKLIGSQATNWTASSAVFPSQYSSIGSPAWWAYWIKLYDSYTVLGCHWKLLIDNIGIRGHADCMCVWDTETYTALDTTNKFPSVTTIDECRQWKGMNYKVIEATCESGASTAAIQGEFASAEVISGSYKPYQANHLVQNDQDTKTWHKVTESPTMSEDLHMMVFPSPLATSPATRLNCFLEMKFIVQFKDLKTAVKYPTRAATPIAPTLITDTLQALA